MSGVMTDSSAFSSVGPQLISSFMYNVEHNPFFLFTFIIPIILILLTSAVVRAKRRGAKIDGPPTLEQKREKFIIPSDFFNDEAERIRSEDYHHFLDPMEREFHSLKDYDERFTVLMKRFRKYEAMTHSGRKKRKKMGYDGRKATFNDLLNLYNWLRKAKFELVEFEQEEEKIL